MVPFFRILIRFYDFKMSLTPCSRFLKQYSHSVCTTRSSYIYIYIYIYERERERERERESVCVCVWWSHLANAFFFRIVSSVFQISNSWTVSLLVYIDLCNYQILFQGRLIKFHIKSKWYMCLVTFYTFVLFLIIYFKLIYLFQLFLLSGILYPS